MEGLSFLYAGTDLHKGCTARHSHRGWEILYLAEGEFQINFPGDKSYHCVPGDLLIIAPHVVHERVNTTRSRTWFAVFETETPEWESPTLIPTGKDRILQRWLNDIADLHKKCLQEQSVLLLKAIISRIRYLAPRKDIAGEFHPAVRTSCIFMAENYGQELTIAQVAENASISQSHLNLLFRNCLGMTPLQYLRMIRMQAARQLLLNPYSNVSEVAEMCGFTDIHYFNRAFKKFHNVPPGIFRSDPARYADTENKLDKLI